MPAVRCVRDASARKKIIGLRDAGARKRKKRSLVNLSHLHLMGAFYDATDDKVLVVGNSKPNRETRLS